MDIPTRFWTKVRIGDDDECWVWKRGLDHGYGSFRVNGRAERAHRMAWKLVKGPIPERMHVLHHCDNPPCVNPAHLYLGTDKENARDRKERGRMVADTSHAIAKRKPGWNRKRREDDRRSNRALCLTDEQIRTIREDYADGGCTFRSLADAYGVSHPTIKNAIHGRGGYGRVE
jgi:hypothetical protein